MSNHHLQISARPKQVKNGPNATKRGNRSRSKVQYVVKTATQSFKNNDFQVPSHQDCDSVDDSATAWARWPIGVNARPASPSMNRSADSLYNKISHASQLGAAMAFNFDIRNDLKTLVRDTVMAALDERDSLSRTDSLVDQCIIDCITRNNTIIHDMRQHIEDTYRYHVMAVIAVPLAACVVPCTWKLARFLFQR